MINTDVVLVLGAGASKAFGYPTGGQLKAEAERESLPLSKWLIGRGCNEESVRRFFTDLQQSGFSSIDEFIECRPDVAEYERIGKRVIAKVLISYEDPGKVFEGTPTTNWYKWLFKRLTEDGGFDGFAKNKLAIITFNYDRSLEFFLARALESSFGKSRKEAAARVMELPIVHVHGILSPLPYFGENARPYSKDGVQDVAVEAAASGIRIVHQIGNDDEMFGVAQQHLSRARLILFLGFGYARRNVERLRLSVANDRKPFVHGTKKDIYWQEFEVDIVPLFTSVHGGFRLSPHGLPDRVYGDLSGTDVDVIEYLRTYRKFFRE